MSDNSKCNKCNKKPAFTIDLCPPCLRTMRAVDREKAREEERERLLKILKEKHLIKFDKRTRLYQSWLNFLKEESEKLKGEDKKC